MLMERNDIQPLVYGKLVGIHRNTLRMKRLITELLDFRKQEQGFEKFKYSKQDIYSFLDEIYLSFKEYARGKQIIFEYFNKDRSLDVWFDVVQLERLFITCCRTLLNIHLWEVRFHYRYKSMKTAL